MQSKAEIADALRELWDLLFDRLRELPPQNHLHPDFELASNSDTSNELESRGHAASPSLEEFPANIERHRGFQWLNRLEGVTLARSYLEELPIQQDSPSVTRIYRKTELFAFLANSGFLALSDYSPRLFTTEDRKQAVTLAQELRSYVYDGIWRLDVSSWRQLEKYLDLFIADMSKPSRRVYQNATAKQRYIMSRLAMDLRRLGFRTETKIAEILCALAPDFRFDLSLRTAQRYVSKAISR